MGEVVSNDSATYLIELHQKLIDCFSWAEIEDLCFRLGIEYEIAPGTTKPRWVREKLNELGGEDRLPELLSLARKERPNVAWPPVPVGFQMPPWPEVWDGRHPYLGLKAFQEGDAEFFFGREGLVDDLLGRLQESRFIVIAGPSGSGKSSVARAGLFHALRNDRLEGSKKWLLASMSPKGDPIQQLATAVSRLAGTPAAGDYLRREGPGNSLALHNQVEALEGMSDDPHRRFVLLVDQFEEIFTQTKDEKTRAAFINLLTAAVDVSGGRTTVILSLRSDFVSNCASYQQLRALMSRQFQLVGAMVPKDLAKAITLPALEVGAEIDPALVSQIINDMRGEPGALPLMSFALRDLFEVEKTEKGRPMDLTLPEYISRGGIESALERQANHVFDSFTEDQKELARCIFSRLVEVREDQADTRRTASLPELRQMNSGTANINEALEKLVQARLITIDGDQVEIGHEALIHNWPRLRSWMDKDRECLLFSQRLTRSVKEWIDNDRHVDYLFGGARLAQVESRIAEYGTTWQPSAEQEEFIKASQKARDVKYNLGRQEALLLVVFAGAGGAIGVGGAAMILNMADGMIGAMAGPYISLAFIVGAITGLVYVPFFDRSIFAIGKRNDSLSWPASILVGAFAFVTAALWLFTYVYKGWWVALPLGVPWGSVAGAGRMWIKRSNRPWQLTVLLVSIISGIPLAITYAAICRFAPDWLNCLKNPFPLILIFVSGVVVPLVILFAEYLTFVISRRRSQ